MAESHGQRLTRVAAEVIGEWLEELRPSAVKGSTEHATKDLERVVRLAVLLRESAQKQRGSSAEAARKQPGRGPASSERSEEIRKSDRIELQIRPDFQTINPEALKACGECGPLRDVGRWGFNQRTGGPCKNDGCELGPYRAFMYARQRSAEEAAHDETGPSADPAIQAIVNEVSSAKSA